jgi:hypothetical protein
MVLNATFNYILVISWKPFYWWERPREKHWSAPSNRKKCYHIMLYRIHTAWAGFELTTFMMTGTYCIGSFKSNYRIITTTMALNDLNDMYNIKDLMLLIMIMIWFSNPNLFNEFQLNHFKTETWMERIEIHVWCPTSSMPIIWIFMFSINQFQLTNYILYVHFLYLY